MATSSEKDMQRKWKEEDDARVLAQSQAIQADPARLKAAVKGAKRLKAEEEKRLKEQEKAQAALAAVASGKVGKPAKAAPKKAAKRKSAKRPTAKKSTARGGKGRKR